MDCGLLAGDGPIRCLAIDEAEAYDGPGFLWTHLHGRDDEDIAYLKRQNDIPEVAAHALLATETRPRCDRIDFGAIVNLRGPGDCDPDDSDRLVSIRLWIHDGRVTSLSRRKMTATDEVMRQMNAGQLTDPGDLVAAYARTISVEVDPLVSGLSDTLDTIECDLSELKDLYRYRRTITGVRTEAISYRRFVSPNRDALNTLAGYDFEWLSEADRVHINEAGNRFARMAEELEAVRERAALLHEQITDLRAEQMEQRSFSISVVAFVFLPLTFLTGLMGMNVGGIPFAEDRLGFWFTALICLLVGGAVAVWFGLHHWLRRDTK